jgi:hypothetical protein
MAPAARCRMAWIASFRTLIRGRRIFKLPPHTGIDRLTGSIDVAAKR